jgi:flagellar biosynthesis GTPase FlhF
MPVQDKVNPWSLGDRLVSELKKKNLIAFLGVIFLMFCVLWLLISNFSNRNFETKKFAQRNKEIESKKAEEFEKKKAEEFEKKKAEKFEKEKRHIENEEKKKQKMMEACRDFIDELIVDQHKKAKKMFNDPEFLSELAQRECTLKEIKLDVEKSEISYFGGDTAKVYVKFKLDLSMKSDFSRETSHVYTTGTSIGKVIWNGSEAEKGEVVEYAED